MRFVIALCLLLAGCTSPDGAGEAPVTMDDEPAAVEQVLVGVESLQPIEWDGHTKEGFWVCESASTTGTCAAGQQIQPDNAFALILPIENLTALDFTVSWMPADPSQTGLVFAVYDAVGNLVASAAGQSPLQIMVEGSMPGPTNLTFMAWPEGKTPTEPSVFLDATQQPFHVEGAWTRTDQVWMDST